MQAQDSTTIKDQQRAHWDTVADGWGTWLEWTERNFALLTSWLGHATAWGDEVRVLDVACGAGYPSLAAAAAVGPRGRVTAVDISPPMIAAAGRRARAAGLHNIAFDTMDAEVLRFADGAFDAVVNAYGLMFCPDPSAALREAHRVLAPGGRLAVVTWDEPAKSPFFTAIRGPAERALALAPPDPSAPGPFRLASSDALRMLLAGAGFEEVRVESLAMTFECASVDEYLAIFADFSWKARIARLSEEERRRFRDDVVEATRPYRSGERMRLVATSLCASGRR